MIKILLLSLSCLLTFSFSYGQDYIKIKDGRFIKCDIISVDSTKINAIINNDYAQVNSSINISDVDSYKFNGKRIYISNPKKNRQNLYNSEDGRSSHNAINIGYIGLQTVSLSISYEHLFNEKNGLVIGLPILNTNKGKEKGFNLSYRNHFKNTINSGYWGIFAMYSKIESKLTATGYDLDEYRFNNSVFCIGPNIGRRWVSNIGLNFAIRFGYGIPLSKNFEWIDIPEDEDMKDMTESMMKIISGFDAEFSIGYCF